MSKVGERDENNSRLLYDIVSDYIVESGDN